MDAATVLLGAEMTDAATKYTRTWTTSTGSSETAGSVQLADAACSCCAAALLSVCSAVCGLAVLGCVSWPACPRLRLLGLMVAAALCARDGKNCLCTPTAVSVT